MYTENSPEILERIKSEKIWFEYHLENWNKIVRWIEIKPLSPLRWGNQGRMLQQKYFCIVHFREHQSFGGFDDYENKSFEYWLDVPLE
jgi:hypothetical protein